MPRIEASWYVIEEAHIDGIVIWQNELGHVYQTSPFGLPKKRTVYLNTSNYSWLR